ncbi:MAG: hypothetical protein WDO72_09670 [Pseudomonadota bacterium]
MKSKLLFILGIVVAHGAVGAGLMHDLSSPAREVALTCAHTPTADPYFAPQRELLAMSILSPAAAEAIQP